MHDEILSDVVYEELLAGFSLELLTVNLNDCVHLFIYYLTGLTAGRNHLVVHFFGPQRHKSGAKLVLFCELCKKKRADLLLFCVVALVQTCYDVLGDVVLGVGDKQIVAGLDHHVVIFLCLVVYLQESLYAVACFLVDAHLLYCLYLPME